ncbi:hypothetical protein BCR34DRAFT_254852 [Clohesyomyces aquaticus]|uniref:Uncharacterized protein n=1 Tax=Clohesyomyces aquaticus TaxID=1231657 RepID=A0A1Y1ZTZ2_9PLEO|nr:hypothetical protein BCR34DRAFT_254852 [Clohesyomyces aquaticus]
MVLQDLDPPPDSFSDDGSPPSNESASSTAVPRFIPSELPKPFPLPTPFLAFSERSTYWKTEMTLNYAQKRVGRPLAPEESQALAQHIYKMEQRKSYAAVTGVFLGTYKWYTTMATSRYPFYQPRPEDVNPNKFLTIKGPMATTARHSARFLCYYIVGGQMGKIIGQTFAQPLAAKDSGDDPRLVQFGKDLKVQIEKDRQTVTPNARQGAERAHREGWDGNRDVPPHAGTPRPFGQRRPPPPPPPADDDMSPTAGNDPWTSEPDFGFPEESKEVVQPSRPARQQPTRTARPPRAPYDEDVSPTGGRFQDEVQSQNKPGESAWERLRRGQGQNHPPQKVQRDGQREGQREGSTLGDSWAFAESDEERRRAQQRSQKEFDDRLERERQGKDYNDEKRW